jgi:hypothetical protein
MTQHFKIEKGVPIVRQRRASGAKSKYPLHSLDVSESFSLSSSEKRSVATLASRIGMGCGKRFSVLRQTDGSYRCWRIA